MNLFEKSGQSVGDNSSAIQVSGDAHFGNTTTEVITICQLVIQKEMASLREDAYALVDTRAKEFGTQISAKLSQDVDEKLRAKLADPDIQYTINQAVIQVARKGFDAKSELLKELIISKLNSNEEEDNLLLDQAVEITPRLTISELKLLSFIYYFRSCDKTMDGINISQVILSESDHSSEKKFTLSFCQKVFREIYQNYHIDFSRILGGIETLKPVDLSMMGFKGCIRLLNHYEIDYYKIFSYRTGLNINNEDGIEKHLPLIKSILEKLKVQNLKNLNSFTLSPIGEIIGRNYLKSKNFLS